MRAAPQDEVAGEIKTRLAPPRPACQQGRRAALDIVLDLGMNKGKQAEALDSLAKKKKRQEKYKILNEKLTRGSLVEMISFQCMRRRIRPERVKQKYKQSF